MWYSGPWVWPGSKPRFIFYPSGSLLNSFNVLHFSAGVCIFLFVLAVQQPEKVNRAAG
jgi:hypothetical protein